MYILYIHCVSYFHKRDYLTMELYTAREPQQCNIIMLVDIFRNIICMRNYLFHRDILHGWSAIVLDTVHCIRCVPFTKSHL